MAWLWETQVVHRFDIEAEDYGQIKLQLSGVADLYSHRRKAARAKQNKP
jgi:hypothetical protein